MVFQAQNAEYFFVDRSRAFGRRRWRESTGDNGEKYEWEKKTAPFFEQSRKLGDLRPFCRRLGRLEGGEVV